MNIIYFFIYIILWIVFAVILYSDIKNKSKSRRRRTINLIVFSDRENESGESIVKSFNDIKDIYKKNLNDYENNEDRQQIREYEYGQTVLIPHQGEEENDRNAKESSEKILYPDLAIYICKGKIQNKEAKLKLIQTEWEKIKRLFRDLVK